MNLPPSVGLALLTQIHAPKYMPPNTCPQIHAHPNTCPQIHAHPNTCTLASNDKHNYILTNSVQSLSNRTCALGKTASSASSLYSPKYIQLTSNDKHD